MGFEKGRPYVHVTLPGVIDQKFQELNEQIELIQAQHEEQKRQTVALHHGVQNVISDTPSSLKVEFYGNTLVNRVPNFNSGLWNFHTNITVTSDKKITLNATSNNEASYIDVSIKENTPYLWKSVAGLDKYVQVLFKDESTTTLQSFNASQGSEISPSGTSFVRIVFTNSDSGAGTYTFEDIRLYEIDQATYDAIGVTLTDDDVERMYPYVDSVQHVKNPVSSVSGSNIADNRKLTDVSNYTIKGTYDFIPVKVAPNTKYTIKPYSDGFNFVGNDVFYLLHNTTANYSGMTLIHSTNGVSSSRTITSSNDGFLYLGILSTGSLTKQQALDLIFKHVNLQMNVGDTAKPFVPYNPSYLYAEVTLAGLGDKKDILYQENGQWKKQKNWETDVALDGSLPWSFIQDYEGFVRISVPSADIPNALPSSYPYVVKDNGNVINGTSPYQGKDGAFFTSDSVFQLSIPDEDATGYDLTTQSGIQTFFNDKNYFLSYQLAEPVTEVEGIDFPYVEGDLSIQGDSQVSVSEGVIVREEVTPVYDSGNDLYYINRISTSNPLTHKTNNIIYVYENGIELDSKVTSLRGFPDVYYGGQGAYISPDDFDPNATYTVTYEILDKHDFTTNLNEVKATFSQSLKSSFQAMTSKQSDLATDVSVHARQLYQMMLDIDSLKGGA